MFASRKLMDKMEAVLADGKAKYMIEQYKFAQGLNLLAEKNNILRSRKKKEHEMILGWYDKLFEEKLKEIFEVMLSELETMRLYHSNIFKTQEIGKQMAEELKVSLHELEIDQSQRRFEMDIKALDKKNEKELKKLSKNPTEYQSAKERQQRERNQMLLNNNNDKEERTREQNEERASQEKANAQDLQKLADLQANEYNDRKAELIKRLQGLIDNYFRSKTDLIQAYSDEYRNLAKTAKQEEGQFITKGQAALRSELEIIFTDYESSMKKLFGKEMKKLKEQIGMLTAKHNAGEEMMNKLKAHELATIDETEDEELKAIMSLEKKENAELDARLEEIRTKTKETKEMLSKMVELKQ